MVPISAYLVLAAVLFGIGTVGVLVSRNMIVLFMSIEIMLNAANLVLVAFSAAIGLSDGHVIVFLVMTVAAAEAAVGLAMVVMVYRNRETINIDRFHGRAHVRADARAGFSFGGSKHAGKWLSEASGNSTQHLVH